MVGNGTRIDEFLDKFMFIIYDYTNATRLFRKEFISKTANMNPSPQGQRTNLVSRQTTPHAHSNLH